MCFHVRRLQYFLLEVILLEHLHFIWSNTHEDIIDAILEALKLFLCDRKFLRLDNLEHRALNFQKLLQALNFFFPVLHKGHNKRLMVEIIEDRLKALLKMLQIHADHGCQVSQREVILLEVLLTVLFEDIASDVRVDLFCGYEDVCRSCHP